VGKLGEIVGDSHVGDGVSLLNSGHELLLKGTMCLRDRQWEDKIAGVGQIAQVVVGYAVVLQYSAGAGTVDVFVADQAS
jgi:hypothetical protein